MWCRAIHRETESRQSNGMGWQDEHSAVSGYRNCQCRGDLCIVAQ